MLFRSVSLTLRAHWVWTGPYIFLSLALVPSSTSFDRRLACRKMFSGAGLCEGVSPRGGGFYHRFISVMRAWGPPQGRRGPTIFPPVGFAACRKNRCPHRRWRGRAKARSLTRPVARIRNLPVVSQQTSGGYYERFTSTFHYRYTGRRAGHDCSSQLRCSPVVSQLLQSIYSDRS